MSGGGGIWPIVVPGEAGTPETAALRLVSSGFFDTTGTPLRAGRDFNDSDGLDAPPVAIVSESFIRRYWPNQDPIGRTFHFDLKDFPFAEQERTIVGVVGDVRFRGLERQSEPQVYLASKQLPDRTSTFYAPKELVVRSSIEEAALVPAVRSIIRRADREMPISEVRTLREVVDLQTGPRSTQLRLVGAFAGLSLLLASIGIHGLLSFAVGQRRSEFGLRIALGAQRRDILSIVLRDGFVLAAAGTGLGLILSYFAGQSIQALLAGVAAADPVTFALTAVVAFTMTLSGSLLPALRATRADPTAVIRGD
jgi:predicted permease